jgi:hypothetical protein
MKHSMLFLILITVLGCAQTKNNLSLNEFEFKIKELTRQNLATKTLADGWYHISVDSNQFRRIEEGTNSIYYIDPKPIVLPLNFEKSEEFKNREGDEGIAIYFDAIGTEKWSEATKAADEAKTAENSYLIFILDDKILTAQRVRSQITNGASVFWKTDLSKSNLDKIKQMLNK